MNYFTITEPYVAITREKGSKFIAVLESVISKEDVENKLKTIRSKYPDASHHCYATRLNPIQLIEVQNDDGEPNGTAGLPILNSLRSAELVNILLVVVRYFGGTKLGKSGLISTYSESSKVVIEEASKVELMMYSEFEIEFNYDQTNLVETAMMTFQAKFKTTNYKETVKVIVQVPKSFSNEFERYFSDLVWTGIRYNKLGDILNPKY